MKQYIVDAFTDRIFSGNPAAVCVLEHWLPEQQMQNLAMENNLSETAFIVPEQDGYQLRWFTPNAAAYVLFRFVQQQATTLSFSTQSGNITVQKRADCYEMNFPAYTCHPVAVTAEMEQAIGVKPLEAYLDRDLLLVLENADVVRNLQPDFAKLSQLDGVCIAVTARDTEYDCISRVFAPKMGVPEDPVTGSTHCMIVPYWCEKLGKSSLTALQASRRSGVLYAKQCGNRIQIAGKAVLFAVSEIFMETETK